MKKTLTKEQQDALEKFIKAEIEEAKVNLNKVTAKMEIANKARPIDKLELSNLLCSYHYWEGRLAALQSVWFEAQFVAMK